MAVRCPLLHHKELVFRVGCFRTFSGMRCKQECTLLMFASVDWCILPLQNICMEDFSKYVIRQSSVQHRVSILVIQYLNIPVCVISSMDPRLTPPWRIPHHLVGINIYETPLNLMPSSLICNKPVTIRSLLFQATATLHKRRKLTWAASLVPPS